MRDFTGVSGAAGGFADSDTRWTPEVANAIVQEIAKVITDPTGGNAALNEADNTQLLGAIIRAAGLAAAGSMGSNGNGYWRKVSDGAGGFLIEQWGQRSSGFEGWSGDYSFPIPFEVGVEYMAATCADLHTTAADGNAMSITPSLSSPLTAFAIGSDDVARLCWWSARGR